MHTLLMKLCILAFMYKHMSRLQTGSAHHCADWGQVVPINSYRPVAKVVVVAEGCSCLPNYQVVFLSRGRRLVKSRVPKPIQTRAD